MTGLPCEIVLHIFDFLDVASLFRVPLVCREWFSLSLDDSLWNARNERAKEILQLMAQMHPDLAKKFLICVLIRLGKRGGRDCLPCLRALLRKSFVLRTIFDPPQLSSTILRLINLGMCSGYDSSEN